VHRLLNLVPTIFMGKQRNYIISAQSLFLALLTHQFSTKPVRYKQIKKADLQNTPNKTKRMSGVKLELTIDLRIATTERKSYEI
jgi:hypothetical protein